VAAVLLIGGGGATALGAGPGCTLAPQLRDLTINQGLGSYTPLTWGKDTLVRLYMSQPSCAASGSLIQVTGATLTVGGGGTNRTISATTPSLVSVYPALATYSTAPAVDSTGDVKFDIPGAALSPTGSDAGFTATFTATINYVQQPNSRTALAPGSASFNVRPGTTTAITAAVSKKTNALRVLVVPMGDPTKLYNTQLTAAGQQEIQRGMLTLARIFPLRDGIATLTDTSAAGLAAGLRYSISPTLLDTTALTAATGGMFCSNGTNFGTLRGLLAQFLQAWNSANPATPADRVLGVGDQVVTNGSASGCDEGRAAINGNEAWVRLAYDAQGTPSNAGALMGMELAHTMGAVPAGRNDGAFHSLYTNSDYLVGDLNRAFNVATRSVLAGTSDDHTVMRLVSPWNNTNTVLEKADWGLLLCRLGGPPTSDCTTAGTVGSAAAGPAFVMSGTTDGSAGIGPGTIGTATGTTVVESYFSQSATTLPDAASQYRLVQKQNSSVLANQGVPIATADTHHDNTPSETHPEAALFSIALPFNTSATRIELWKGQPGASGSLLLYARNRTDPPVVTSQTTGSPILLSLKKHAKVGSVGPLATRVTKAVPARSLRPLRALSGNANCVITQDHSINGDTPSSITFDNQSGVTVGIYWLDYSGNRVPYFTLPSGENYDQPTWLTHPWVAVDDAGNCLGYTISDQLDKTYVIRAPLVVNSADDIDDGACDATHCSLREAINTANANAGPDTIVFAIGAAASSQTIQPTSGLPAITEGVLIDGWSQGGTSYAGPPLVELDGSSAGTGGLLITGADSTVQGLAINRFSGAGIDVSGAGAKGNDIKGNYIGTNAGGTAGAGNAGSGIQITAGASNNTIGGTAASARNVVSGNSGHGILLHGVTGNTVQGNYAGTSANGSAAIPNGIDGIAVDGGGNNTIGGTASGAGNLASGNTNQGISIFGVDFASTTGNVVRGNIAGTNAAGTAAIPNGTGFGDGVRMLNAINTTVVGNLISGNPFGVRINGAVSTGNTVQGNYIGTNLTGATAIPNTVGVLIENDAGANTIGGASAGQGNLISGNTSSGIALDQGTGIVIQGNSIGASATGSALGNGGNGIRLGSRTASEIPTFIPATNTQVGGTAAGAANLIANNGQAGVAVLAGQGNSILGNSISANGALGIDLDADGLTANDPGDPDVGSNGRQNFPIITDARTDGLTGTLNSVANATFRLEFFSNATCDASGNGEGKTYLGTRNVTTDGAGNATFSLPVPIAVGEFATATATDSANNTSEFSACKLVATGVPAGNEQSNTTATDDNADFDLLDLFLDCGSGKGKFPIALALKPGAGSDSAQANWTYNYDTTLACEGGKFAANVNDGFSQSNSLSSATSPVQSGQKSPFSAILSPGKGKTFLQYSAIPLKGIAVDPEDGALTPHWRLLNSSDTPIRETDGTTKDLSPGASGWVPGTYTVELTATDTASKTTKSTVEITIVADADNDGVPASSENGCLGSSDTNPMDAYADKDADGIPNVDDPQPCTAQTGPYTAVMTFQPSPFPIPSSGNTVNVTIKVPYRSLSQVLATSVAITKINGDPVTTFKSVSWKVTDNVGQALFDRQALVNYFTSHQIHNSNVVFTISGRSAAPTWSFEGVATTFVAG
jgi:CSLREA domain-containing protein